ncbi:MAG: hypothetical protein Q8N89_12970 [Azonexus sp.]|nr:hypothetical protein [Azonexus sp.]
MDYSAYPVSRKAFKATACIDRLYVEICTSRHTQFQWIQDWLEAETGIVHFVEPIDKQEDKGNIATTFRIWFHDDLANDAKELQCIFLDLAMTYPLVTAPRIVAIEVACDFRHKQQSVKELLAFNHRVQSSFFVGDKVGGVAVGKLFSRGLKHRQFDPALIDTPTKGNRYLDLAGNRINPEFNLRVGNKDDDLSWQIYFKQHDRIKVVGDEQPKLDKEDWRVRIETTIQGKALTTLGLVTLDDLRRFRFDKLAHLFRFRRPVAPESLATAGDWYKFEVTNINLIRKLNDATPARGMHSFDCIGRHTKNRKWRAESRHIEPDDELQNAVKGALKRLRCGGDCANFSDKISGAGLGNPYGYDIGEETPINCINTLQQHGHTEDNQHPDNRSPATNQRSPSRLPASASPLQSVTTPGSADDQHNHDDATLATVAKPPRTP